MRNVLAYLLLFSFAFLVTPKEVFHSHEHDNDHDHEASHEHSASFDEDCFVCDFDLNSLAGTIQVPVQISNKKITNYVGSVDSRYAQSDLNFKSSRGPPVLV